MPVPITTIENQQELEVVVSGPEDANRMFIVSGIATTTLLVVGGQQKETFTALVGPELTNKQFIRAMATASLSAIEWVINGQASEKAAWRVLDVDADFDDEAGKTRLRIEAEAEAGQSTSVAIETIAFQATILAAV